MGDEPFYELAYKFRRILVPVSPMNPARLKELLNVAVDFGERYGAEINFLYVTHSDNDPAVEQLRKAVEDFVGRRGVKHNFKVRKMGEGETIASEIVKELSESAYDLVILLSRGYYGASALLYNSTSVAVALAANTSVLILR
ncbi:Universal stress protein UspA-related nucleotide-binding protein [Pyrobaculum oguniense TE7]|uniref:Universal stress protein UspA-related nucleotide-binding protein n=1 Tax=Pyrobaculum oguniense (strain DSM 13380 / JCM 10595 / TE7) TaxID=698757 RepID=H6Q999_PYROT|nr:Universal stress protein UspA-related nucleotide-binding protein [Pyrobaculum oguniense TE7]